MTAAPTPRPLVLLASAALFLLLGAARADAQSPKPVSVPRYTHPGAGQVFYFVLTDRFANGSPANDTGGIAGGPDESGFDPSWNAPVVASYRAAAAVIRSGMLETP